MLSSTLLSNTSFNTDTSVQNLELLKLRFGAPPLREGEVMIKDIDDSKRVLRAVRDKLAGHEREGPDINPQATIVSHCFWPALPPAPAFKVPRAVRTHLDAYAKEYHVLKSPREIVWCEGLGVVELAVEVGGVEKEFSVDPFRATVIGHFGDRDSWSADELAAEMETEVDVLRQKTAYWVQQKVLIATGTGWVVADSLEGVAGGASTGGGDEEEDAAGESAAKEAAAKKQQEEIAGYISGFLTNLGELPLGSILNKLRMIDAGSEADEELVRKVLRDMKSREEVEDNGGIWSKVKK
ncbi:hypothetical protein TeGR_g11717 [Tetraparma gracilis]|uniref:Anaphase-promoting complex subunit 2 n=1 Tax=Tetraparma gracilis TaxID=2962635 RepID=A0ABQ6MHK6_9STRA|nr:hypothetical protein TeGR_g11717 [Tetraparma gracilis]